MRKSGLLILIVGIGVLFWSTIIGCCLDNNVNSIKDLVAARDLARSLAVDIKREFSIDTIEYKQARFKYQAVTAELSGIRAELEYSVINNSKLKPDDVIKSNKIVLELYKDFVEYAKEKLVLSKQNKGISVSTATPYGSISLDPYEIWKEFSARRKVVKEERIKWINKYFTWEEWDAIIPSKLVPSPALSPTTKPTESPNPST
jgi:hypothetical protein